MAAEEVVFDSWEDFEDSGALDKQLKAIKVLKRDTNSKMLMKDSGGQTAYQPQIKILKRQPGGDAGKGSGSAPKPMKTLEQREAEYAEARQRILGAAYSNNEEVTEEEAIISSNISEKPSHLTSHFGGLKLSDNNVIRQPTGPDGTKGFHVKR